MRCAPVVACDKLMHVVYIFSYSYSYSLQIQHRQQRYEIGVVNVAGALIGVVNVAGALIGVVMLQAH